MRASVGISLLVLLTSACGDYWPDLDIFNETDQTITVTYEHDGSKVLADRILAGGTRLIDNPFSETNGCSAGDLVARSLDGRVIARRTEKLCIGDTWIIGATASPSR